MNKVTFLFTIFIALPIDPNGTIASVGANKCPKYPKQQLEFAYERGNLETIIMILYHCSEQALELADEDYERYILRLATMQEERAKRLRELVKTDEEGLFSSLSDMARRLIPKLVLQSIREKGEQISAEARAKRYKESEATKKDLVAEIALRAGNQALAEKDPSLFTPLEAQTYKVFSEKIAREKQKQSNVPVLLAGLHARIAKKFDYASASDFAGSVIQSGSRHYGGGGSGINWWAEAEGLQGKLETLKNIDKMKDYVEEDIATIKDLIGLLRMRQSKITTQKK